MLITGKIIALPLWAFVGKVMSLLYNMLSQFVIAFLPRHRQLANLITRATALSNSIKLSHEVWGHPRWTDHGEEV